MSRSRLLLFIFADVIKTVVNCNRRLAEYEKTKLVCCGSRSNGLRLIRKRETKCCGAIGIFAGRRWTAADEAFAGVRDQYSDRCLDRRKALGRIHQRPRPRTVADAGSAYPVCEPPWST